MPPAPDTYAVLRRAVEAIVVKGRNEIDGAWVRTYHETGRLITEHLLQNKARADYGAQVVNRLASYSDTQTSTPASPASPTCLPAP